jgi:membrane protease YdiL (CAAX protease family)
MQDDPANVNLDNRPVPWSGSEIGLAALLAWVFWPQIMYALLKGIGFDQWYYDSETPGGDQRLVLWVGALAAPFQVLTYPLVFAAVSRTRLEQLGLTTRRLGRNFLAGLGGMLLIPDVFALFWLVRHCYGASGEEGVEKHFLEQLAGQGLSVSEWILLVFTAVFSAPLHEELAFRGVLQPWLAKDRWRGLFALLGALMLTLWYRRVQIHDALPRGFPALCEAAAPSLFVSALVIPYLLAARLGGPQAAALIGASALFACIHSAWPTPIPLFLLALGLGLLAQQTQSLVAPILLHSLFNLIGCVQLALEIILGAGR